MTCLLCISVSPALSTESGVVIQSIIFGKKKKEISVPIKVPDQAFPLHVGNTQRSLEGP